MSRSKDESMLLNALIRTAWPFMQLYRVNVGRVKTEDGYWFDTGVPKGYPDLHGIIPAKCTVHGHAVPVFIEAKIHPNKPTPEQLKFLHQKRQEGCLAAVCYSVKDFWDLVAPVLRRDRAEDGDW